MELRDSTGFSGEALSKLHEELLEYRANQQFLNGISLELVKTHPGEWVGVINRAVVTIKPEYPEVLEELDRIGASRMTRVVSLIDTTLPNLQS